MNGYTILGKASAERVGFDVMALLSGLVGSKKDDAPAAASQAQIHQMQALQAQEDARRAREQAARARATAWTVGGIAGAGLVGILMWKVLAR